MKPSPASALQTRVVARGKMLNTVPGRLGAWFHEGGEQFTWADAETGELRRVRFQEARNPLHVYPDGDLLLCRTGRELLLRRPDGEVVARTTMPPLPPEPLGYIPVWEGHCFSLGHRRLWWAGWGEDGLPELRVYDARSLELLGAAAPITTLLDTEPCPISDWGETLAFLRPEPDGEPVGLYGNGGDSFCFLVLFEQTPEGLVQVGGEELEEQVRDCSDQTVPFVAFLPGRDALVAGDDLGHLAIVRLPDGAFEERFVHPIAAFLDEDERVALPDTTGRPLPWTFDPWELDVTTGGIFYELRATEYPTDEQEEELADLPAAMLMRLDPQTLMPQAWIDPETALQPMDDYFVTPTGLIAVEHGEETRLVAWVQD